MLTTFPESLRAKTRATNVDTWPEQFVRGVGRPPDHLNRLVLNVTIQLKYGAVST